MPPLPPSASESPTSCLQGLSPRSGSAGARRGALWGFVVLGLSVTLGLQNPLRAAPVDFAREVRPLLSKHCGECHGEAKQKGGLRLDHRSDVFKTGESGDLLIVPGKSGESGLLRRVLSEDADQRMPPKGRGLGADETALLRRWIDEGAHWPDSGGASPSAPNRDKADWWSLKPVQASAPGAGSLDAFVDAALRRNGLVRSAEADRRTLLRRLSLVVHGLLPEPEAVEAFVRDPDPEAYLKRVEQYLASPHYGEKWAQHWLDAIGWGETHGFEINTPRPDAWPYRDYVIEAFNKDLPYPEFILHQIAGDTVSENRAMGFLMAKPALLPGQIGKDKESMDRARQDELNDMVSMTGGVFLGMTLQCARCHDHKFDPISQRDYYGLQAVFSGVRNGSRPAHEKYREPWAPELETLHAEVASATHDLLPFEPRAESGSSRGPVAIDRNLERFEPVRTSRLRFTLSRSANPVLPLQLEEIEVLSVNGQNVARASLGAQIAVAPDPNPVLLLHDGRYGERWTAPKGAPVSIEVTLSRAETVEALVWSLDRREQARPQDVFGGLAAEYRLEVQLEDGSWKSVASSETREKPDEKRPRFQPAPVAEADRSAQQRAWERIRSLEERTRKLLVHETVYAGVLAEPQKVFRLHRGDVTQVREEVVPSAIRKVGTSPLDSPLEWDASLSSRERRLALARWLGSERNPLTARVMVNRIWQHVFGEGLVSTPNDFGHQGAAPSHPELLDWLASEFMAHGWSVKHIERLLLVSAAFRQSSAPHAEGLAKDSENRLLWRYPPRRMDAESIRDTLLQAAGTLDTAMGGPGFLAFKPNSSGVRVYEPKEQFGVGDWRRMIYMTRIRVAQEGTFGAFDCPDFTQDVPRRQRSTTALQALNLFNSPFILEQAGYFAQRVARTAGGDPVRQVEVAFQRALQRNPGPEERECCQDLVRRYGLQALGRVLFNCSEMLLIP
jgi:hypothetical protein